jgi:mannose/fructose-specific phosphotransferase system component IIA
MIGVVIIAHSSMGKELITTAEYIVGKIKGITSVSVDYEANVFEARIKNFRSNQRSG